MTSSVENATNVGNIALSLNELSKSYQDDSHNNPYPAINNFSLDVIKGEILALLGPSGCGKTTLLRVIAGFEVPQQGSVTIANREITGPRSWVVPEKRNVGFVFQDYALFPHMNALQNVMFGLKGMNRKKREERAKEVLDLVCLNIFSKRMPHQLSGGQQQRVALARALAPSPSVILLDEPFSNLDAAARGSTREEVRQILKKANATTILVTHDQEEALSFADRVAVMRAGKLEQIGTPESVYASPRTAFVASFLGHTNLLWGDASETKAKTILGNVRLSCVAKGNVLLSIRPEDLCFNDSEGIDVEVTHREFKGHDLTFHCRLAKTGEDIEVQTDNECAVKIGSQTKIVMKGIAVPLEGSNR